MGRCRARVRLRCIIDVEQPNRNALPSEQLRAEQPDRTTPGYQHAPIVISHSRTSTQRGSSQASAATRRLLLALVVIVELIEQAAFLRLERPMIGARRTAGVGRCGEGFAALAFGIVADGEVTRDQVDLFPVVVNERRGRVDARLEAQQPRTAAHLARLVEVAGEDLLLDAGGIAWRRHPSLVHVEAVKFEMRLVHRHHYTPRRSREAPADFTLQITCDVLAERLNVVAHPRLRGITIAVPDRL